MRVSSLQYFLFIDNLREFTDGVFTETETLFFSEINSQDYQALYLKSLV